MADKSREPIFIENPDDIPAEIVPDNFVSYTLKHQEALPPITWKNWHRELHWLHVFILFVPPTLGLIGAWNTPLQLKTAIWFVVYSHLTGFGTLLSSVRRTGVNGGSLKV
jgi:stearoyl-CoA desaturase (delta-9 desaturase)